MGQLTELALIRKKRNQKRNLRKFVLLLITLIVIAVCMLAYDTIKEWDLRTKLDDMIASMGSGPGYPVDIVGGEARKIFEISNMPALVNDTNAYIYNAKGKLVTNVQHGYNNPIGYAEKGKMLLFDLGGTRMQVSSRSKTVYSKKMEKGILSGDISATGEVCIATESENYVGEVTLFNRYGDEIFKWYSAENIVTQVSLSDDGDYLSVATVNSKGGALVCYLYLFKVSSGTEIAKLEFDNELPVALNFKQGNQVALLTDKAMHFVSSSGRAGGNFSFDGQELYAFDMEDKENSLVVLGDYRQSGKVIVQTLGNNAKPLGKIECSQKINSLSVDSLGSYLTLEDTVEFYTLEGELIETTETPMVQNSLVIASNLYYTTHNGIYKEKVKRALPSKSQFEIRKEE